MHHSNRYFSATAFASALLGLLLAFDVAPGSPVRATVTSTWTFDPSTRLYTYRYVVTNHEDSPNAISRIGLRPIPNPLRVESPPGWRHFRGWQSESTAVVWAVVNPGPEPPNWNGRQIYVGPYHLHAGQSLGGFLIRSTEPPDSTADFFPQGFDSIPMMSNRVVRQRRLWEEHPPQVAIGPKMQTPDYVREAESAETLVLTGKGIAVTYTIPRYQHVSYAIHDRNGRLVRHLALGSRHEGTHHLQWDGTDASGRRVPPGRYFCRLTIDGQPSAGPVIFIPD